LLFSRRKPNSLKCVRNIAVAARLELATSVVTALRELVLQQPAMTRGLANAAQVIQGYANCGLSRGLEMTSSRIIVLVSSYAPGRSEDRDS
jgi:hypothetical protein